MPGLVVSAVDEDNACARHVGCKYGKSLLYWSPDLAGTYSPAVAILCCSAASSRGQKARKVRGVSILEPSMSCLLLREELGGLGSSALQIYSSDPVQILSLWGVSEPRYYLI